MTAEIRTGVPYKPEEMARIYEEGAIVDLSRVNFPTCKTTEENMHALFVYLRNTGYDVTFDFTESTKFFLPGTIITSLSKTSFIAP